MTSTTDQWKQSSFGRAMAKAEAIKAAGWRAYDPLTRAQLWDDMKGDDPLYSYSSNTVTIPALIPDGGATRSTLKRPVPIATLTIIKRPTEALAILRAQGMKVLDTDLVFERQAAELARWYCIGCRQFKHLEAFAEDSRFPAGRAFYCHRCREEHEREVWRDRLLPGVLTIKQTA